MKSFGITEWNEKRILKNTIFFFHNLQQKTAFYFSENKKYMLTAELDDTCSMYPQMTANDISFQSETIIIEVLY